MTSLGDWLRSEIQKRGLTQMQAAVHAGVGQATISDILVKGHVPKVEILFRLADFFGTPREKVLRLAGHLPVLGRAEPGALAGDDYLVAELLEAFRAVPDEWKPDALAQVKLFVRLANRPPVRYVGEDQLLPLPEEVLPDEEEAAR